MRDDYRTDENGDEQYYRDNAVRESGDLPNDPTHAVVESGEVTDLPEYYDQDSLRQNANVTPPNDGQGPWTFRKGAPLPLDIAARQWEDHSERIALFDASGVRFDAAESARRNNARSGTSPTSTTVMADGGRDNANASNNELPPAAANSYDDTIGEDELPPAAAEPSPPGQRENASEDELPSVAGGGDSSSTDGQRQNAEGWEKLGAGFENLVDHIDSSDLETLRELPSGTGPETTRRLMKKMAERGTGAHDIEVEDPTPDFEVPDDPRQNGHEPKTDGGTRQNATESELPPAAGEDTRSGPKNNTRINSTQNQLAELSDAATAVFGLLESRGSQSTTDITPEIELNRRDTQKALTELKNAGLAQRANSSGWGAEYEPTPIADR